MRITVVAQCEKCGREFLAMPNDGLDHYDRRSGYRGVPLRRWNEPLEECLGKVLALDRSRAEREGK